MSAAFRPRLVNGRFGDPALYVALAHEREALLFDLGDLAALSARDLLRVRTIGISHMHIDHLIGFDALLRVNVGREAHIRLVGPEGLADRLGHKLQGYSWDLVERYATELCFDVGELHAGGQLRWWRFRMAERFAPEFLREEASRDGIVIQTQRWSLRAAIVEHHGPCLAFALEEPEHLNVWRNMLEERSLPPGRWLNQLKEAIRTGQADETRIAVPGGGAKPLSELRELVTIGPGMKLGYATDLRDTPANRAVLQALLRDCDVAYIEASFAAADAQRALDRAHLTTTAAGEIAKASGAKRVEPFHFSPRHEDEADRLMAEVAEAFAGGG